MMHGVYSVKKGKSVISEILVTDKSYVPRYGS
jgi:hypothetical protein